ncbi:hypothetical protein ACJMK2_012969 [Sinanodonta woodiana]|uniref:Uncharacterized protein n=1 Tax=Sinanodonta woodiana TaxID=1069815 RepID=A0ABD3VBQ9_SINWO
MELTSRRRIKHSIKDMDFDFDINDISRASTPTSTFSSKSEGRRREKNYSSDDYKRKIARLKSELDMEKARNKKIHKDKSHDLKQIQEESEKRHQNDLKELEDRLQLEKKEEMKRFEEEVLVKKDKEVQQVLRYKEEEMRQLKLKHSKDKDTAIAKVLETEQKKQEEKEKEFQEQLQKLKVEKDKFEQNLKKKSDEQIKKEKEFMKIKEDYDTELRRILGESKKLALGNLEKLKKAEKALSENYESEDESFILSELVGLSDQIASGTSSRTVSRSLASQSDFLKLDEHNIDALLASVTPSPAASQIHHSSVAPSPASILGHSFVAPSPLHAGIKSRSSSVTSESSKDLVSLLCFLK